MILYTDFHIHTGLSPCGDIDMTPNNIVNMAIIKGLDAIAITDHNSSENVLACAEVGLQAGLLVIPGMELQTREDVHVVCLFESVEGLFEFQDYVYNNLPEMYNRDDIFGEQLIFDSNDNIIKKNLKLLLTSTNISFDDAFYKVCSLGGVFIPAHIDREANSIISNLGFMPDYLNIRTVEYKSIENVNNLIKRGIIKNNYNFIKSSDAHYLGDILEQESSIEVESRNIKSILARLSK